MFLSSFRALAKKQLFYFFSALAFSVGKKMNVLFVRWLF
jgi:hypothetical protein